MAPLGPSSYYRAQSSLIPDDSMADDMAALPLGDNLSPMLAK